MSVPEYQTLQYLSCRRTCEANRQALRIYSAVVTFEREVALAVILVVVSAKEMPLVPLVALEQAQEHPQSMSEQSNKRVSCPKEHIFCGITPDKELFQRPMYIQPASSKYPLSADSKRGTSPVSWLTVASK